MGKHGGRGGDEEGRERDTGAVGGRGSRSSIRMRSSLEGREREFIHKVVMNKDVHSTEEGGSERNEGGEAMTVMNIVSIRIKMGLAGAQAVSLPMYHQS